MKALVTGASGFVGGVLLRRLLAEEWFVRAAVRNAGRDVHASERVVVAALSGETKWAEALEGIDTVFHLAAVAHRLSRPERATAGYGVVNADGTAALAWAAVKAGVGQFVYVSTAKVMGEESHHLLAESDLPAPEDPYASSKLAGEEHVRRITAGTATRYTILRPPLVYGPGVRANFLSLVRTVDRGIPLPIAGLQTRRSYVSVENFASALAFVAGRRSAYDRTFFVSDGEDLTTADLVRRIARSLGRSPRLFSLPPSLLRAAGALVGRSEAMRKLTCSLQVDASALRSLGWTPPQSLDEGLAETAAWYRSGR